MERWKDDEDRLLNGTPIGARVLTAWGIHEDAAHIIVGGYDSQARCMEVAMAEDAFGLTNDVN